MIRCWSAPLCLSAAAMLHSNSVKAGVWGVDPVLGVTADYATNPVLLRIPHTEQTDAAVLIDAPTTFTANDFKLSVLPSFRVGDTRSYSSVNSDYEHLNVKAELDAERSIFSATAGLTRDSSLYQDYLSNGEAGARRDGATADLNWDRFLTEKLEFNTDASTVRIRYSGAENNGSLVDYKYTSLTPTVVWNSSERDRFTFGASGGQYDSLNGQTRSRNANLQVGFMRALTEFWTLTATGGYSRSTNRIEQTEYLVLTANGIALETVPNGLVLETIPQRFESSQNGSIYSLNLARQGERLTLAATVSRQETPTGFAYLARQNIFEVRGNYSLSERWSLGADARYARTQDPLPQSGSVNLTVSYVGLNAYWRWTEHWTLTAGATRITEHYQSTSFNLVSNQIAITLSRQFNHINLQ